MTNYKTLYYISVTILLFIYFHTLIQITQLRVNVFLKKKTNYYYYYLIMRIGFFIFEKEHGQFCHFPVFMKVRNKS